MIDRCPACGRMMDSVRICSHEQCRFCGWVCETCCEGADLDGQSEVRLTSARASDPHAHQD